MANGLAQRRNNSQKNALFETKSKLSVVVESVIAVMRLHYAT